jgi:hypothetical protein
MKMEFRFLVRSPQVKAMDAGDALHTHAYRGVPTSLTVTASQPGNEYAIVSIEADDDQHAEAKMQAIKADGVIEHYEQEPEYHPLGFVGAAEENTMGQDFPLVGVTPEWQAAVNYGEGLIIGLADTGEPPQAARDAFFSETPWAIALPGADTVGHGTACASRIAGIHGVLPKAGLVFACALPGGRGTTTTVVAAVRALADARVSIISMSLGGTTDPVMDGEIIRAEQMGVVCSAAAGNDGWSATPGSPARACQFIWGATTLDGSAPAGFSSGGCNWELETGAIPGDNVGLAHLDGGYGVGSGTSFACPVGSALVAAALPIRDKLGSLQSYFKSHQIPFEPAHKRGRIMVQLSDFDEAAPPPLPDPGPEPGDLLELVQEASLEVKRTRATPWAEWPAGSLEAADAYLDAAIAMLESEPPPDPTPTTPKKYAVILFPGGGWLPPGPIPANYKPEEISQWWASLGLTYFPGRYSGGTGVEGVAAQMASQIITTARDFDGVLVAGHSAGATALLSILNPKFGVPQEKILGFVSIAGAALALQPTDQMPYMTGRLVQAAFGDPNTWVSKTPYAYLTAGSRRFPLVVLQGAVDDQLPMIWANRFVKGALNASWQVLPSPWMSYPGLDHFSVNPPGNADAARLVRNLVGAFPKG